MSSVMLAFPPLTECISNGAVYGSTWFEMGFCMELQTDKSTHDVAGAILHAHRCDQNRLLSRSNIYSNVSAHDRTCDHSSSMHQRALGPLFCLLKPVVFTTKGYFRYVPTLMLTEVSQLICIAICHRAKSQVALVQTTAT